MPLSVMNIPHKIIIASSAVIIYVPLSLIFRKSYYSYSLPKEWKMTNVVPVHKKEFKSDVALLQITGLSL